jgi:hypothetical protein
MGLVWSEHLLLIDAVEKARECGLFHVQNDAIARIADKDKTRADLTNFRAASNTAADFPPAFS